MPSRKVITFKPIRVPKARTVSDKDLYDAILREADAFAKDMRGDLEKKTRDWKKPPKYKITKRAFGNKIVYTMYTSSKKFIWVSHGVKKHKIRTNKRKAMKLKGVKRTHTLSLITWRTSGAIKHPHKITKSYQTQAYADFVMHPGIKAQKIEWEVWKRRKPSFSKRMHAAIDREIKRKRG